MFISLLIIYIDLFVEFIIGSSCILNLIFVSSWNLTSIMSVGRVVAVEWKIIEDCCEMEFFGMGLLNVDAFESSLILAELTLEISFFKSYFEKTHCQLHYYFSHFD